jgi:hypothetical protein
MWATFNDEKNSIPKKYHLILIFKKFPAMKKICFLLLLLLSARGLKAQTASDCTPTLQFLNTYGNDAADLALSRIYALHAPDTALVAIPPAYTDTVWWGLAAICNTGLSLQADSVYARYCIHSYPHGNIITSIQVVVDTNYAWTHAWEASLTVTGNAALDSFMARYGFTVSSFDWTLPYMPRAILQTTQAINTKAFADSLLLFPGATAWYRNSSVIGVNNWITYSRDTASYFTFTYGWDDCMSGCINTRSWTYTVYNNCSVVLSAMHFSPWIPTGPTLPNCDLFPLGLSADQTETLQVYPDPAQDVLHLSAEAGAEASVYDMAGRRLMSGIVASDGLLDIRALGSGVYILSTRAARGVMQYARFSKL